MKKHLLKTLFFVLILGLCPKAAVAFDDNEYWSYFQLTHYKIGKWSLNSIEEVRIKDDIKYPKYYSVGPRIVYTASDHLNFATYNFFIRRAPVASDDFITENRLGFEATPSWDLNCRTKLLIRNRLEFRWIQNEGSNNTRFRQRWEFRFATPWWKQINYLYCSDECFYSFKTNLFEENWLIPLGLDIQLDKKSDVQVYYMIQIQRSAQGWRRNQVFATQFNISL